MSARDTRTLPGLAAVFLASGGWLAAGNSLAQSPRPPLSYTAPTECPGAEAFEREIETRLADADSPNHAGLAFEITVNRRGEGYIASVRIIAPAHLATERSVGDPDCREVVRAAAFIAAVLAQHAGDADRPVPSASGSATGVGTAAKAPNALPAAAPPNPPPSNPPASRTRNPDTLPDPHPRRLRSSPSLLAWMGLAFESAVGPHPVMGPRLGVAVGSSGRVASAARVSFARVATPSLHKSTGDAELVLLAARADICAEWSPRRWFEGSACAGMDVGSLQGEGSSRAGARRRSAVWLAPGFRLRFGTRWVGPLGGYLEGGLGAPIVRPRFYFTSSSGEETVHDVPSLSGELELGLALNFP